MADAIIAPGAVVPVADPTATPPAEPTLAEPAPAPEDKVVFTPEQQVVFDKAAGAIRIKAREQAKTEFEAAQADARKKADEAANLKSLEDEKKFQEIIDLDKVKIAEIEPALEKAKATLEATSKVVQEVLDKMVDTLGEAAKTAIDNLPGKPDLLEKLAWLTANEELFKTTKPAPPGTPPRKGVPSQALKDKQVAETPALNVNF